MEKVYDIRALISLLLSKLWFIVCMMLLCGLSTYMVSKYVLVPKYASYTTMYVNNKGENNIDQNDAKNRNASLNDLKASQTLVSTYIAVLKSDSVMNEIKTQLQSKYSEDEISRAFNKKSKVISIGDIKKSFSMDAVEQTEVLKIIATTKSPEISAALCNIIAKIAPDFLVRVVGAGSVEIIDLAKANFTPVSPKVFVNTLIGVAAGLIFAVILIFLIDFFDNTIKDIENLSKKYDKAILGEVQSLRSEKAKRKKDNRKLTPILLTRSNIPFNIIESYKSIRTNILFSLGTDEKKVIEISSANPGEGKSTTSANIAIALTQMDSKVLLIDGDLRKPVQHKLFKVNNSEGLSTLIIGRSTLENSIKENVIDNLDLLTSGPIPPNPSELLASKQFGILLDKFSQKYDYVIIDTPPINLVSDALGINNTSGIMLVIKHASTTQEDLTYCMERITLTKTNMLGFVVNDIHREHGSGYYKNYKYKYYRYKYKNYEYTHKNTNNNDYQI